MIVLAVSGMMFLIGVQFIGGREARTSFTAGSHELASRIASVIEQVSDGQYSDIPLYCTASASQLSVTDTNPTPGTTTGDCTFVGKFVHFLPIAGQINNYEVFSLAGARQVTNNSGDITTSLSNDLITAIDPNVTGVSNVDLTIQQAVPQNLHIQDINMYVPDLNSTQAAYGLGFIQTLGSVSNNSYVSGGQNVTMVYAALSRNDQEAQAAPKLSTLHTATSATICVTDGTRYATINLGGTSTAATSQLNPVVTEVATC